jgi:RecB family endonuclease NucS
MSAGLIVLKMIENKRNNQSRIDVSASVVTTAANIILTTIKSTVTTGMAETMSAVIIATNETITTGEK